MCSGYTALATSPPPAKIRSSRLPPEFASKRYWYNVSLDSEALGLSSSISTSCLSCELLKSTASSGGVRLDTIRFAHLNSRSMNNKAASICDIVVDKELDFFCLCEMWHQTNDNLNLNICALSAWVHLYRPTAFHR